MKYLFHICVIVVVLGFATGYWLDSNGYDLDSEADFDDALGVIDTVSKRRGRFCMRWGMVCVPESNYKFTKCCPGLNCVCNLWKTHCKCRSRLG